ncbi:MAG: 50S ribosomal protein L9 [Alphaproteobacteria bacterium]|jgi:large subunit ribosomal protein L9|nr:50S ribosomal protein L9 [Alphaproteobacteria bacterium]
MDIILLERIENLGQMGDLVKVKPGYARNFLLPTGKALRATKANMERFESERVQREADNLTRKSEAEGVAKKMNDLSVSLIRAASEMGQLYGSVTSRDIAEGVTAQGFTISKNQVDLNTAIKTLGLTPVNVILHPEVSVEVTVNIARSKDEAEEQIKLGRAIVNDVAERERLEAAEAAKAAEQRMAEFDAEDYRDTTGRDDSAGNDADADANDDASGTDDVADENANA